MAGLSRLYGQFSEGDQAEVRSELSAAEDLLGKLLTQTAYLPPGGPAHRLLLAQVSAAEGEILALEGRLVTPKSRLDAVMGKIMEAAKEAEKVRAVVASGEGRGAGARGPAAGCEHPSQSEAARLASLRLAGRPDD